MTLKGKRVLVTGGSGFLGRVIIEKLKEREAEIYAPRSITWDLRNFDTALECIKVSRPQVVIHSAAFYGGLGINRTQPGKIYFDNLVMGANVVEASRLVGVEKLVVVGTVCSYPDYSEELKEENLFAGPCHKSVQCYAMTKKMMQIQCEAYYDQWQFVGVHALISNLYGEWDSYTPERSHAVAALIRKFVEAQKEDKEKVDLWGTGKPIREFLYIRDAAEGIIKVAEKYFDVRQPINIGTGVGTSIKKLAELISKITGFKGKLVWDKSKPDGQYKRIMNIDKMKRILSWEPRWDLDDGLKRTIIWFKENYNEAIKRW